MMTSDAMDQVQQEPYVQVLRTEYERLLQESEFLAALRAGGVDNWDGYDYAVKMVESDE